MEFLKEWIERNEKAFPERDRLTFIFEAYAGITGLENAEFSDEETRAHYRERFPWISQRRPESFILFAKLLDADPEEARRRYLPLLFNVDTLQK